MDILGNHEDANFTLKRCMAHLNFDEMGLGKTIQVFFFFFFFLGPVVLFF